MESRYRKSITPRSIAHLIGIDPDYRLPEASFRLRRAAGGAIRTLLSLLSSLLEIHLRKFLPPFVRTGSPRLQEPLRTMSGLPMLFQVILK
jgi:hypothetical protein